MSHLGQNYSAAVMGAVFVASMALLALQIITARLLSAALSHHYAFAVLSLSMLGLGLGGVFTHNLHAWRSRSYNGIALIVLYAVLTSVAVLVSLALILYLASHPNSYNHLWTYWLAVLLPFIMGGAFFAEIYKQFAHWGGRIYALDLLGAALGSSVAVALLALVGGVASQIFMATMVAYSGLLLFRCIDAKHAYLIRIAFGLAVLSAGAGIYAHLNNHDNTWLKNTNPEKEIFDAIQGDWSGAVTDSIWSAFGRTQLITYATNNNHRDIYIDGTAGTPMYKFSGNINNPGAAVEHLLASFPGFVPFKFVSPQARNNALIIGPGGGRDVLLALAGGFKHVTAVEVNPDLLTLMHKHADYNGGLYQDVDGVEVINAEGRHYIQRNKTPYDLIMMSLPVTNTSRSREGFSLTESYLLTQEALGEYLNSLTDQGQLLVITHDELAVVRLVRTVLDTLHNQGLSTSQAMQHIYVLGSFPYPIVVVSKQAFEPNITLGLLQQIQQQDFSVAASYVPYALSQGYGNPMLQALAQGHIDVNKMQEYVAQQGYDISSVTDNQPFFYYTDLQLPKPVSVLFQAALVVAALVLVWPLIFGLRSHESSAPVKRQRLIRGPLVFAALGAGFMLVEVSLVQRLTFFLGDPVLALAVLLGGILLFMAAGSFITTKTANYTPLRLIAFITLGVAMLCLIYSAVLPSVLQYLVSFGLAARIVFAFALIAPFAIVLGMPFPLAIRHMHKAGMDWSMPWMWAVNGVFSVLGAALAVVIAMNYGMAQVLYVAAGIYFALAITARL